MKHGVSFEAACKTFEDEHRVIVRDVKHSHEEPRFHCIGRTADGILTVTFTFREDLIRIIAAGYWRKGRETYAKRNAI